MNNIDIILKNHIKEALNKTYTEYKEEYLKKLDNEMELRRNKIVGDALNGISIAISENSPYSNEPNINIIMNIKKDVYLKEGK